MLSVQADAGMMSADQANWHERLDAEIGNLRAALSGHIHTRLLRLG